MKMDANKEAGKTWTLYAFMGFYPWQVLPRQIGWVLPAND